jgi:hypothetical protein
MTLIIGCITKEFGIIVGDTQLSVGDLNRGEINKREVEIKVSKYGSDFIMGILGKWSWFCGDGHGKATYINEYDTLRKLLNDHKREDKLDSLNKFIAGREEIDATAIYVKRNKDDYELDLISSKDSNDLKVINIEGKKLVFNEPFYHYDKDYIQNKIIEFNNKYKLTDNLTDTLFLLNNICLEIIAGGNNLTISKDKLAHLDVTNSVGGYVTIQIMNNEVHHFNCLYQPYRDLNVLLDKTTYPFSYYVNNNKVIRYIDNISMLVKSCVNENVSITKNLVELINMQTFFLVDEKIIQIELLNNLINFINEKYNLGISRIEKSAVFEQEITLALLLDNEVENDVDIEYLKRFF